MRPLLALLLTASLLALAGPAAAQWEEAITDLLREETGCEADFIAELQERTEDGQTIVEARVHCADGRTFDVSWNLDTGAFTHERCGGATKAC